MLSILARTARNTSKLCNVRSIVSIANVDQTAGFTAEQLEVRFVDAWSLWFQLKDTVQRFAQESLAPLAEEIDRKNEFPMVYCIKVIKLIVVTAHVAEIW